MTVKDFLINQSEEIDYDVYDDYAEGNYYCLCKQDYKPKLFADYADIMDLQVVEVSDEDNCIVVHVECDREERRLVELTHVLAGYCDEETFNEYVIED